MGAHQASFFKSEGAPFDCCQKILELCRGNQKASIGINYHRGWNHGPLLWSFTKTENNVMAQTRRSTAENGQRHSVRQEDNGNDLLGLQRNCVDWFQRKEHHCGSCVLCFTSAQIDFKERNTTVDVAYCASLLHKLISKKGTPLWTLRIVLHFCTNWFQRKEHHCGRRVLCFTSAQIDFKERNTTVDVAYCASLLHKLISKKGTPLWTLRIVLHFCTNWFQRKEHHCGRCVLCFTSAQITRRYQEEARIVEP